MSLAYYNDKGLFDLCFSMFHRALILALFLFAIRAHAADPFVWEAYGYWGSRAANPSATCESYVRQFAGGSDQKAEGVSLNSETAGVCHWSYWTGDRRDYVDIPLRRFGTECSDGSVYNKKIASCEFLSVEVGMPCESVASKELMLRGADGVCTSFFSLPSQEGRPEKLSCIGNPINLSSGNKYQVELDYQYGGKGGLLFFRTYNSIDGIWRHNFSDNLRIGEKMIVMVKGDGAELYFRRKDGVALPISRGIGRLELGDKVWVYTTEFEGKKIFDLSGRLIKVINPQGYEQGLEYLKNSVVVKDGLGKSLRFTEDFLHQPSRLSFDGGQIEYIYDSKLLLISMRAVRGEHSTTRAFEYLPRVGKRLLASVTDERGVKFGTWDYDNVGRAVSSEHSGSVNRAKIEYNVDGSTTIWNELGRRVKYGFEVIGGSRYVVSIDGFASENCPANDSRYTYNERGFMLSKTDAKGLITTYAYNDRGLETSRTEASGTTLARTVTTEWDPDRFLPIRVTEPDRITTYGYDNHGRESYRQDISR
ncbi:DUF6531 domain-containing protein [Pseudomonas viridiflava]|uniref:DUF6531 domain-containing protein n=1 Tax=Pseudomonas viridiflava TaxID=33069 RepID=UPI0018E5AF2C|nr:DUF6531 domain-containing protein [Pseudomonas viridiflava]MBI6575140.1 RHS repeat protein [Pseudomonas viridiflava]MBI6640260.1 RHS repeat protein [Pseudomonas viridiflava]